MILSNEKTDKPFVIHPEGTFIATCRDIYNIPNKKYGKMNSYGNPEPKEKVVVEFLTDEPVEFNGKMEPSLIRIQFNPSWGEKSSMRKFVSNWIPALGKLDRCDTEQLIGKGAYLTIVHNPDATNPERIWANIRSAAPPPKGAGIPMIPADFVRHQDKEAPPVATAKDAGIQSIRDGEDQAPF